MKLFALALTCITLALPASLPAQNKDKDQDPIIFGQPSHNAGCIIFAEGHQTTHKFYGLAATSKTIGKLTVIETQNYTFDQKVVPETQDDMNNLMRIAQKDHIKFVKIPEKYSPELLEKARTACN
jgi:hypothetical protein